MSPALLPVSVYLWVSANILRSVFDYLQISVKSVLSVFVYL